MQARQKGPNKMASIDDSPVKKIVIYSSLVLMKWNLVNDRKIKLKNLPPIRYFTINETNTVG